MSNSLAADFCVEALEEAIDRFGAPEIFNTDQGSQFTAADFTAVLRHEIRISMDGRGAWRDNVFVERLWNALSTRRSICTPTRPSPRRRPSIGKYFAFFNTRRPHSPLTDRRPIPCTSKTCRSRWQLKPRGST